jgi:hypothetical protein
MPPRNGEGRSAQTGPRKVDALTKNTVTTISVTDAADNGPKFRRLVTPVAFASAFGPSGRRAGWAIAYRCPSCGGHHLGRARDLAGCSGPRRSGCGRRVVIRVARTYRGPKAAEHELTVRRRM